mmetsp:Transcript_7981/g.10425  ORF Transcript_7981/g.10425 Transcript_7981/m.10425 type:complete len:132 (-) Transcript_7981:1311-1706(-)
MTEFTISLASPDAAKPSSSGSLNASAILKLRREMRDVFGWQEDYGKLTSSSDASQKREKAERQADSFVRNCCIAFGGDTKSFDQMIAEFDRVKEDFGWKTNYGKLTFTKSALKKRAEAEEKAENVLQKMSF